MVERVQIMNTCTHIFTYAQNDAMRECLLMRHIVNPASQRTEWSDVIFALPHVILRSLRVSLKDGVKRVGDSDHCDYNGLLFIL